MIANDELLRIMERISDTTATEAEIAQFNAWCNAFKATETAIPNLEEIKERVLMRVHDHIGKKPKVFPLYIKRIAVAAAAIAAITLSVWFYTSRPIVNRNTEIVDRNDMAPGKNAATLTFSNGKTIRLSNAKTGVLIDENKLTYDDGTAIAAATAKEITAVTPRGGTYQIRLPDGSKVWLNAASSIKFPSTFNKLPKRTVQLSGEAYFEISKDKAHPFVVQSAGQQVEVLGTHFNISSYPDETVTRTTLLEGSVQVAQAGSTGFKMLRPGQQSVLKSGRLTVEEAIADDAVAWKDGFFTFNDEPLAEAMLKICRWYNAEVVFKDEEVARISALGTISKYSNVSKVLSMMEKTGHVHFEIKGKTIIVTR